MPLASEESEDNAAIASLTLPTYNDAHWAGLGALQRRSEPVSPDDS